MNGCDFAHMSDADLVWNRATMEKGGSNPRVGDCALTALLGAHGLAMNGGVLHAIELLDEHEFTAAKSGYQFFGFDEAANLLGRAKDLFDAGVDLDEFERMLDDEYSDYIPDDATIFQQFEQHFLAKSVDFAPV